MVAADPLVNLLKYVVPFYKVDTLQERGREYSSVKLSVVQYVSSYF